MFDCLRANKATMAQRQQQSTEAHERRRRPVDGDVADLHAVGQLEDFELLLGPPDFSVWLMCNFSFFPM